MARSPCSGSGCGCRLPNLLVRHSRSPSLPPFLPQIYGDGAAQLLTAGRGVLHEEMWDFSNGRDVELFQIWINLPGRLKGTEPSLQLVGETDSPDAAGPIPEVTLLSSALSERSSPPLPPASPLLPAPSSTRKVVVRILVGEAHGVRARMETLTPQTVLHVSMDAGSSWAFPVAASHTLHVYVRKGPVDILVGAGEGRGENKEGASREKRSPRFVRVETHETAFTHKGGELLQVHCPPVGAGGGRGGEGDFLVLAGEPLGEPVAASGPWVFNDAADAQRAYARYQAGVFGLPWGPALDDEAWKAMCDGRGRRSGGGEGEGGEA